MNAAHLARSAYARPDAPQRNPRAVEYDLFARITRALTEARAAGETGYPALVRAVHDNGRLWRTLAADLADPANALPQDLKARLFWLHEFTAAHGQKVLSGRGDVSVLVEINTAVMRGLRGNGGPT